MASLHFVAGTLELRDLAESVEGLAGICRWDVRSNCFRAPASAYAPLILALKDRGLGVEDQARQYLELDFGIRAYRDPRPFQSEALDALRAAKGRGVVVLPTGAGKTHVAILAIDRWRRSTLVVAPTLDLGAPVVRPAAHELRRGGRRGRRRRVHAAPAHRHHLRLRVPAHGALRRTASAASCSTSATTCRPRPTRWRPSSASRRSASASPPRSSAPTAARRRSRI